MLWGDTKNPVLVPFVSNSPFAGVGEVLGSLLTESLVPLIDNPPLVLVKLLTIGWVYSEGAEFKIVIMDFCGGFSLFSDNSFLESALPHTISKEKVVVAYDQVTQNRRS